MNKKDMMKILIASTDEEFHLICKIIALEKEIREERDGLDNVFCHEVAQEIIKDNKLFIEDYLNQLEIINRV